MPEPSIRTARRQDLPAIIALLADDPIGAAREAPPDLAGELDEAYWRAFEAIDADQRNRLVVLDRDGEVVGTLQLTFIPSLSRRGAERAVIEGVRVRGDARGDGLGRRLVTWAIEEARSHGCRLVQLTSDKRRTGAHRFYASLGFAASHEGMKLAL